MDGDSVDLLSSIVHQLDSIRSAQQRINAHRLEDIVQRATLSFVHVLNRQLFPSGISVARLDPVCSDLLEAMSPGEQRDKATFELDGLLLGLTMKYIYTAPGGDRPPAIIVPVNYLTLHEKRFSNKFITLCRRIDEAVRRRIVFELLNIPPNVPDLRLQDLLSCLAPFSAHRMIRVLSFGQRFMDLNRLRLAIISVACSGSDSIDELPGSRFEAFVKMVHNGGMFPTMCNNIGCRVLVHNVPDNASACWYAARGADFLTLSGNVAATSDRYMAA